MKQDFRIPIDRILHSHGVAEYMYSNAGRYELNPDEMYVLGLLHDIGYVSDKANHESAGALLLQKLGYNGYEPILWHGTTPDDFLSNRKQNTLPSELRLLLEANLQINSKGEFVGYMSRLDEVKEEYGINSRVYRVCRSTIEWLLNNPCQGSDSEYDI